MRVVRNTDFNVEISRRKFLNFSILSAISFAFIGCHRDFKRPAKVLLLGTLDQLLFNEVYIPDSKMLVFRDSSGWSALSARCTYDGCDLSYQEKDLYCPCCRSYFSHAGLVLSGKADSSLPYFEMIFKDAKLYADSGKIVGANYRFTNSEIESVLTRMNLEIREHRVTDVDVPGILIGKGPKTAGNMFKDSSESDFLEEQGYVKE